MTRVIDDDIDEFFGRTITAPRTSAPARPRAGRSSTSARPSARPTTATPSRPALLDRAGRGGSAARPVRSARPATRPPRPSQGRRQAGSPAAPVRTARRAGPRPVPRHAAPVDPAALRRRTLRRLLGVVVALLCLVAAITVRLVTVQVADRDRWIAWGQDQRDGWREVPAGRGAILDRNGQPLALSVVQPDVVADPGSVPDKQAAAEALAPILDRDVDDLVAALSVEGDYALLAPSVPADVAEEIRRVRAAEDERAASRGATPSALTGITLQDRFVRMNPSGDLATSVVGRTVANGGVDEAGREGLSGVEAQFDELLTGRPGRISYERDPSGRTIAGGAEVIDPAQPGTDVYLTIDQGLQYEAERAIGAQVDATGAVSGMVLMMRPSTGEILAMASVAVDDEGEVVNTRDARPVTAVFEPGSVNKLITVAGAIEEGLMAPDTVLEVPDHLQLYDKTFTDHDPHPVQAWSVTDILVTSSNIGTIKIAQALGRERVDGYLREFGLGATTGLGFPNEENGIMLPLDQWSGTSIGAIPIGQGIAVTALQMLAAYNVVANDGVYVSPRLVAATDDGAGRTPTDDPARRRVVSTETARALQSMLEKVVTEGTGTKARVPDYPAAGKTGTARIPQGVDPADGYRGADGRYHYQSTFLGFVNGADLSILVTLQDPRTSTYGGEVAAPVFSELAGIALLRSQTPPPALVERAAADVPELSASARRLGGEDAVIEQPAGAG